MSHPPNYPGRDRLKRASARAGSDAYQGAFEAVGAVLVACGFGWFVDDRWETAPWGLLVGVVIGFAAMVLRLVRLGKELHPDDTTAGDETQESAQENETETARLDRRMDDGPGVGVTPGMSDVLREDAEDDRARDVADPKTDDQRE